MVLGSFTHGALAELTVEDLDRMLDLDESLFVEHKSDIGTGSAHGLVRSVAAFANTVGGWLLIGVHEGKPTGDVPDWGGSGGTPTLADAVRDRLRSELDPLPAFEARVLEHPDGPVGVVRVYESTDTPHVALATGAVFIREGAGVGDASDPRRPGGGARADRAYQAAQVRSHAQLLELAARGRLASERVQGLVDPRKALPLVEAGLGLGFRQEGALLVPRLTGGAGIHVRIAPYTVTPRFRDWATTADAAAAVLAAAEQLSSRRGLANDWVIPEMAGARIEVGLTTGARHTDAAGAKLDSSVRVVVDGAGVAGAALKLAAPEDQRYRRKVALDELAFNLVHPVVSAAAEVLGSGEFLGRSWCQVDVVGLPSVLLPAQHGSREASRWVPTGTDLSLPAVGEDISAVSRQAAAAYHRSAGLPIWDPPLGT
ncbi:MAG: ATP-binding protein [Actinomycetota bacterium]|nr:ATP-binding protein [Actinomycetota bacterium]